MLRGLVPTLAAIAAATAAGVAPATARATGRAVHDAAQLAISPQPGTPDASPATQISILGAAPERIRSVRVRGSVSGVHAGVLRAYSANRGASFVLPKPLTQGEHVAVEIRVAGRRAIRFSFTSPGSRLRRRSSTSRRLSPRSSRHFVTDRS